MTNEETTNEETIDEAMTNADELDQPAARSSRLVPIVLLGIAAALVYFSVNKANGPVGPDASFKWRGDLQPALTAAAEKGQPILLYFWSKTCPPCTQLAAEVFPRPELAEVMRNWQAVKVEAEQNQALAIKYMGEFPAFPTFVVLDSTGTPIARQRGFMDLSTLIDWLRDVTPASAEPAADGIAS